MQKLLILLTVCSFFYGCNKRSEKDSTLSDEGVYLKAIVRQTSDICCYKPILDFTEDSTSIHTLTNNKSILFNVLNLPGSLNVVNKKLYVQVAALQPGDFYPCNTFGVPLPALKVVNAKIRY